MSAINGPLLLEKLITSYEHLLKYKTSPRSKKVRRDTRMTDRNFTGCNKKRYMLTLLRWDFATKSAQCYHRFKMGTRSDQHADFLQIPPSVEISQKIFSFLGRKAISAKLYTSRLNLGQFSGIIFVSSHQI